MDKHIYDENNGLWYELQGDYYIPCLTLSDDEQKTIGIWGQRHKRYLKEHKQVTYTSLLTGGKLNSYLADIDKQAEEMFFRLVKEMAEKQGRNCKYRIDFYVTNLAAVSLNGKLPFCFMDRLSALYNTHTQ